MPGQESVFVLADESGGALKSSRLTKAFDDITREAKVPMVSLHAPSHSHASLLLASVVNMEVV